MEEGDIIRQEVEIFFDTYKGPGLPQPESWEEVEQLFKALFKCIGARIEREVMAQAIAEIESTKGKGLEMPTIKELIAHEVADFFAGYGSPGFPDVESGAAQSDLISRINLCIDHAVKGSGLLDAIDTTPMQFGALAKIEDLEERLESALITVARYAGPDAAPPLSFVVKRPAFRHTSPEIDVILGLQEKDWEKAIKAANGEVME